MKLNRERVEALLRDLEQAYRSSNFVDEVSQTQESAGDGEEHLYIGRRDTLDRETVNSYGSDFNLASDIVESQRKLERKFFLEKLSEKAGKGEIPTFSLESVDREVIAHILGSVEGLKKVFAPSSSEVIEVLERETGFNELEKLPGDSEKRKVFVTGEEVYTGFRRFRGYEPPFDAEDFNEADDRLVKYLEAAEDGLKLARGSVISRPQVDPSSAAVVELSGLD
ncbi:MAG: hypothetical protein ABEJ98_00355 [Candidatus Nanohaloarchaea archaeon]